MGQTSNIVTLRKQPKNPARAFLCWKGLACHPKGAHG